MKIAYYKDREIDTASFIDLLIRSGLAARRPVDDHECIAGMLAHADLSVSAWAEDRLVGVARSVTDFHYACYLSDLAVDKAFKNRGIGKALQSQTQAALGPRCKLILIAAPAANAYYEKIGFSNNPRCWVLEPNETIR